MTDHMFTNEEIAKLFWNDPDVRRRITTDIGKFTVAMFAMNEGSKATTGGFTGTGNLMLVNGEHYILTASHVWHKRLKSSAKVGLTLVEDITHRFMMDTAALEPVADLPTKDTEWGPDLVLLHIPSAYASRISVHKVFYDQRIDGKPAPEKSGGVEVRSLLGAPRELATFVPMHVDLVICNFFVNVDAPFFEHEGYDYVDLNFNVDAPGIPQYFNGVSGGGLWDVTLYYSPETDNKLDWSRTLRGIAFWQFSKIGSNKIVRCHGPKSLDILFGQLSKR
jgi:hypothetical protein